MQFMRIALAALAIAWFLCPDARAQDVSSSTVTAANGSTARTLADWMADSQNVKGSGAAGDGTTNDFSALTAGTAPWYLPTGVFYSGTNFSGLNPGGTIRRWFNGGGSGVIKTTEGLQSGNIAFIKSAPSYTGPASSFATLFNGDMQCSLCFQEFVAGASTLGMPTSGYQFNYAASAILGEVYNQSGYNAGGDTPAGRTALQAVTIKLSQAGNGDLIAFGANGYTTGVRPDSTYFLGAPVAGMLSGNFEAGVNDPYLDVDEVHMRDNGYRAAAAGLVRNFFRTATGENISANWPWMGIRLQSVGTTAIDVFYSMAGPARIGMDFTTVQGNFKDPSGTQTNAAIAMRAGQVIYGDATNANSHGTNMSSDTVLGTETFGYTATNGWNFVVGGGTVFGATASGIFTPELRVTTPTVPATSTDSCKKGQISYDSGYVYVCYATNSWKRAALATW